MAPNAFSIPTGTVFHLPPAITQLAEGCHENCLELDRLSDSIARPYLIEYFGDEERADRYLRQRISHFGCAGYPYAPRERAQNINNLMIPVTLFDDTFSKPGVQESIAAGKALHARWCDVFNGKRPDRPGNAAFFYVFETVEAAAAQMTPGLDRRAVLRNNDITPALDQYMEKRLTNIYGWWLTTHVEYAKDIDIGELSSDPDILLARVAAINHITLVNDLYSFPKELDAKEAMNAILVLMRRGGMGLQQAINKIVDLIHEAERNFIAQRDMILSGPLGKRPDIREYLDGVEYLMTGNLRWSQMSPRYFGDQHDGSFVLSGDITITPRLTLVATISYNLFLHPLSKFAGPIWCRASILPWAYRFFCGEQPFSVHPLHKKYGPIVRISPSELSFAHPDAWRDIFGSGLGKENAKHHVFYDAIAFNGVISADFIAAEKDKHKLLKSLIVDGLSERESNDKRASSQAMWTCLWMPCGISSRQQMLPTPHMSPSPTARLLTWPSGSAGLSATWSAT
ncbi:Terpene synthase [Madurella fahalii]|uniref:Terpene synthase n=1 Tax=Madurella fahalii TaxID=1157608 RepID=A0ABQ0GSD9_9PEZI